MVLWGNRENRERKRRGGFGEGEGLEKEGEKKGKTEGGCVHRAVAACSFNRTSAAHNTLQLFIF